MSQSAFVFQTVCLCAALLWSIRCILVAVALLKGQVHGRGQKMVRAGMLLLPVSVPLLILIPALGIVLAFAALLFLPFGLLWLAHAVARLSARTAELEELDASLTAATDSGHRGRCCPDQHEK